MNTSTLCPACGAVLPLDSDSRTPPRCPSCTADFVVPAPPPHGTVSFVQDTSEHVAAHTAPPQATAGSGAAPAIPGYEVLAELGRGGMGVVYKARQLSLKRTVALKMILAGSHAGERELERFRSEAESAARLRHPNIVQIHEIGAHEGLPYFSLEYLEGGTLSARLAGTPLPPEEAARLAEILARAMQVAHDARVVHRDLKPANVLLDKDGTPKIGDFGLAKKLDETGQTQTGLVMGSPSYMAPEQARGESKSIGPAADIYALGVILYEMLTGRPPFRSAAMMDTILQVINAEPAPPRQLNPRVPLDLETICLKCLQKEPARRYASAAELADDLCRYREGRPIQARPIGPAARFGRWCRRNPVLAATGGLALLALVATAGLAIAIAVQQTEHAQALFKETGRAVKAQEAEAEERAKAEKSARDLGVALVDVQREAKERERQEKLLRRETTGLLLERGLGLCEQGEVALGLLWLARALEAAPPEAADLQHILRANLAGWETRLGSVSTAPLQCDRAIQAVTYPPGKVIHTATAGFTTSWDAVTGKRLHQIDGAYPGGQFTLDLAPDSARSLKLVVEPSPQDFKDAMSVQVFDVAARHSVGQKFTVSRDEITPYPGACMSWDNRILAAIGLNQVAKKLELRFWDVNTAKPVGEPLPIPQQETPFRVSAFSPDDKTILTVSEVMFPRRELVVRLWDRASAKITSTISVPQMPLPSFAVFSPDGKRVALVSVVHIALLLDIPNARTLGPLHAAEGSHLRSLVFSPDGKLAATGTMKDFNKRGENEVRLWSADTGAPIGTPLKMKDPISSLAFSPDSRALVVANGSRAHIWQIASGKTHDLLLHTLPDVTAAALSPDGRSLAAISDPLKGAKQLRIWDVVADPHAKSLLGQSPRLEIDSPVFIRDARFSADGKTLLAVKSANQSGLWHIRSARAWDSATGKPLGPDIELKQPLPIRAVTPSADGKLVLTASGTPGGKSGEVRFWDTQTGQPTRSPLPHPNAVFALAASPEGKTLFTGCGDGKVRRWDIASGKLLDEPLSFHAAVRTLAFSSDGRTLLCGSDDKTARAWHVPTGRFAGEPLRHGEAVAAIASSPDGSLILTATADHATRLWDSATGRALGPPLLHAAPITALAISPDARSFLVVGGDQAQLWKTPQPLEGKPDILRQRLETLTRLKLDPSGAAHPE